VEDESESAVAAEERELKHMVLKLVEADDDDD
jgi:hypothetical protein